MAKQGAKIKKTVNGLAGSNVFRPSWNAFQCIQTIPGLAYVVLSSYLNYEIINIRNTHDDGI